MQFVLESFGKGRNEMNKNGGVVGGFCIRVQRRRLQSYTSITWASLFIYLRKYLIIVAW